jgi:hypothetical protein
MSENNGPMQRLLVAEIKIEVDEEVVDSRHSPSRYHYDAPRHTIFNELPFSFDVVFLVSINLTNVPCSVRSYIVFTFVQVKFPSLVFRARGNRSNKTIIGAGGA